MYNRIASSKNFKSYTKAGQYVSEMLKPQKMKKMKKV